MNILVLSYDDVVRLLPMEACIEVMADALRTTARRSQRERGWA